jgi:hypothetical protein
MQSLTLNAGVDYAGPPLQIPADKVFDVLPQNIPGGEFLFTPDNLNEFNTQAFGKDTDYTKLLQHDVEEEEKVLHLCQHSKKSAIAFRLINKFTPALLNTVIRCSSTEKVALEPPCRLDFVNSYCV